LFGSPFFFNLHLLPASGADADAVDRKKEERER
jgi:hypothetical protein